MTEPVVDFRRTVAVSDLSMNTATRVIVDETPIALVRTDEGVFAIFDECSHGEVPLSEGEASGCEIECWMHGSAFDLRTGRPLNLPASVPVPVYPVRIGDDGIIEVSLTPKIDAIIELEGTQQ